MRLWAGIVVAGLLSGPALAGPLEDSQTLYDQLVKWSADVAVAIDAPVSRPYARELETELYQPMVAAWQAWEDAAFASRNYRSYEEFEPCRTAGQLLSYVTDEVIQHHLGNDQYEGSMKYRHGEPFVKALAQCETQISAARAEMADKGSSTSLAGH